MFFLGLSITSSDLHMQMELPGFHEFLEVQDLSDMLKSSRTKLTLWIDSLSRANNFLLALLIIS